jgi:hypothetical protein
LAGNPIHNTEQQFAQNEFCQKKATDCQQSTIPRKFNGNPAPFSLKSS